MPWSGLNMFISLSGIVLAAGFLLFFIDAIRSARSGPIAPANPWGASTLEWATSSPPPSYNFARLPVVGSLEPLSDRSDPLGTVEGLHTDRRELLITSVVEARAEARESSVGNSIWPLLAALATSAMLIWSIFTPWAVVWGSIPIAVALIGWFWPKGDPEDES